MSRQRRGDEGPPTSETSCPAQADPPLHLYPPSFLTHLFPRSPAAASLPFGCYQQPASSVIGEGGGGGRDLTNWHILLHPFPFAPVYHHHLSHPNIHTSTNPLKCGNTPGHILSTINKTTSSTFPLRRRKVLRPLPLHVLPLQDYTHGHKYGQPKKNTNP